MPHLWLSEKVASSPVPADIEVVLNTLPLLESELRHVVPPVVPEHHHAAGLQVAVDTPRHGLHLGGAHRGQDEDEGDQVEAGGGEGRGLPASVLGHVAHPGVAAASLVLGVSPHQLHRRLGEVAAVDHEVRPRVDLQDGEHCQHGDRDPSHHTVSAISHLWTRYHSLFPAASRSRSRRCKIQSF